ncbi:MAG TPA: SPOR domain-containing protein [Blastocatellia bacterium]
MKTAKVKQGMVPPVCLALMLLFIWLTPCAAPAFARDYSVQIAAVRSQQCADDMRSGLLGQGLQAYWVRGILPEHGLFYRVRLGKFPSIESAYTYAEVLLNSGLLESYAITAYEAPMSGPLRDMTQASIEVQEYIEPRPQEPSPKEMTEFFAAIGARQWILPSSRNLFAPRPQISSRPAGSTAMTGREMLVFALRSHEWRMTPDPSVFFVRAPVGVASIDLAEASVSPKPEIPTAIPPAASSVISPPVHRPGNPNAAPSSVPTSVEPVFTPGNMSPLTPPPAPSSSARGPQPTQTNSFRTDRIATADMGKGNKPTTSRGIPYGGRTLEQARLQATSELRNGQLIMKLRNLDSARSFTGVARVTLSDDRNSNEVRPMQFNLPPDAEVELPIEDPVTMGSNWMLMVFDENKVMRLLRGESVGAKQLAGRPGSASEGSLNAPQYVTGAPDVTGAPAVFDATGAVPPAGLVSLSDAPNPTGLPSANAANASSATQPPGSVAGADAPAQLTVIPRQIAATTENVTMEFEIAAPQPLNYISVTLAAGDYRDVRQALMSTTRGRVPFLVPTAQATGAFLYEIKDESGRVLAGGNGDFRQLSSGR